MCVCGTSLLNYAKEISFLMEIVWSFALVCRQRWSPHSQSHTHSHSHFHFHIHATLISLHVFFFAQMCCQIYSILPTYLYMSLAAMIYACGAMYIALDFFLVLFSLFLSFATTQTYLLPLIKNAICQWNQPPTHTHKHRGCKYLCELSPFLCIVL